MKNVKNEATGSSALEETGPVTSLEKVKKYMFKISSIGIHKWSLFEYVYVNKKHVYRTNT